MASSKSTKSKSSEPETSSDESSEPSQETFDFAVFTGESVVTKIISAKDIRDAGIEDYDGEDLVWPAGENRAIDLTQIPEAVRDLLKNDPLISFRKRKG